MDRSDQYPDLVECKQGFVRCRLLCNIREGESSAALTKFRGDLSFSFSFFNIIAIFP